MKKAYLIYAAAAGISILASYLAIRKSKEHDNCAYCEKNFDSDYEDGQSTDMTEFDEKTELPFRYEILNEPESDTYYEENVEDSLFIDSAVNLDAAPDENTAADVQNQKIELMRKIRAEDQIPFFRNETEELIFWREAVEKAQKRWKSEIYSVSFPKVMRYITRKGSASASGLKEEFEFDISYSTAKKIMQILTDHKLVSQLRGTRPRHVWISEEMWRAVRKPVKVTKE